MRWPEAIEEIRRLASIDHTPDAENLHPVAVENAINFAELCCLVELWVDPDVVSNDVNGGVVFISGRCHRIFEPDGTCDHYVVDEHGKVIWRHHAAYTKQPT